MGHFKAFRLKFYAFLAVTCSLVGAGEVMGCTGTAVSVTNFLSVPASSTTTTLQVDARPFGSYDGCSLHDDPLQSRGANLESINFRFFSGDGQTVDWSMDPNGNCEGPAGAFASCSTSNPFSGSPYNLLRHIAVPFTYAAPGTYVAGVRVGVFGTYNLFDLSGQFVATSRVLLLGFDGANANITVPFDGPFTPAPVPEPETYAMMLAGLGLLRFAARRRV